MSEECMADTCSSSKSAHVHTAVPTHGLNLTTKVNRWNVLCTQTQITVRCVYRTDSVLLHSAIFMAVLPRPHVTEKWNTNKRERLNE